MSTGQIEHRIIIADIAAAKLFDDIVPTTLMKFPNAIGISAICRAQCDRRIRIPTNDATGTDRIVAEHRANQRRRWGRIPVIHTGRNPSFRRYFIDF